MRTGLKPHGVLRSNFTVLLTQLVRMASSYGRWKSVMALDSTEKSSSKVMSSFKELMGFGKRDRDTSNKSVNTMNF